MKELFGYQNPAAEYVQSGVECPEQWCKTHQLNQFDGWLTTDEVEEQEIGDGEGEEDEEDEAEAEAIVLGVHYPWEGSDRDYKYEEVNVALLQPGNLEFFLN